MWLARGGSRSRSVVARRVRQVVKVTSGRRPAIRQNVDERVPERGGLTRRVARQHDGGVLTVAYADAGW